MFAASSRTVKLVLDSILTSLVGGLFVVNNNPTREVVPFVRLLRSYLKLVPMTPAPLQYHENHVILERVTVQRTTKS